MSASTLRENAHTVNRASPICSIAAAGCRIRLGNGALFSTRFLSSPRVGISAPVLLVILLCAVPQAFGRPDRFEGRVFSIPVSPTVVSTIATKDERLVLLALWRGAAHWYSSGSGLRQSGGIGQNGTINVSLQYGDIGVDLSFDPTAHTAVVQGRTNRIPANANVLLIDGVGPGGNGRLVKAFFFDSGDANPDLRLGLEKLASLLGRSPEIVDFLQCDAFPDLAKSAVLCPLLKKK